jgi:hypothetical protein
VGLAERNLEPLGGRAVVTLDDHHVSTGVEDDDGQRFEALVAGGCPRSLDDGAGGLQVDGHGGSSWSVRMVV